MLREQDDLPGFIIDGHILNNIRHADDTALIVDSEWNPKERLDNVIKENKKEVPTVKRENTYIVINKRV